MSAIIDQDTIAAIATPSGKGGVGIIRLSGKNAYQIAKDIVLQDLTPRFAHFTGFYCDKKNLPEKMLDEGIAIYFKSPNSFTGEDVVELQGHGGPIILDLILKECIKLGARLARPGEFSERAFLNDKIDLSQAEAIADLIDSSSVEAARNALRSLQGEFSSRIHELVEKLIELRIYVEAAIDFPEEEIDFLNDGHVQGMLKQIKDRLTDTLNSAQQGRIMREGLNVVIAGKPNAGKSSLLNALSGQNTAIVTNIEGTTRDVLKEHILIDGMPLHIIDTAGLRESPDIVEQEGIKRAWEAIHDADIILMVVDSEQNQGISPEDIWPEFVSQLNKQDQLTIIQNKCDLVKQSPKLEIVKENTIIHLSAKNNVGIELLRQHLKDLAGLQNQTEGNFTARRRHIDALETAMDYLLKGETQLKEMGAGELLAEDLRYAQLSLSEITGEFTSDDLLGKIFSSFCIGK